MFLSLPFMAMTQSLDDKICKDTNVPKSECEALIDIYNKGNGDNWEEKTNWGETKDVNAWNRVAVEGGHVTKA